MEGSGISGFRKNFGNSSPEKKNPVRTYITILDIAFDVCFPLKRKNLLHLYRIVRVLSI
jgi:hypothetical protein